MENSLKEVIDFYNTWNEILKFLKIDPTFSHVGGLEGTKELAERTGIKNGDKVLDICSGFGGTAVYLAKELNCSVTGVELNKERVKEAISLAKKENVLDKVKILNENIMNIELNEKFDNIISQDALSHISNKQKLIPKIKNWLKEGGRFALTDYTISSEDFLDEIKNLLDIFVCKDIETIDTYLSWLKDSEFKIISIENLSSAGLGGAVLFKKEVEKARRNIIEKYGEDYFRAIHGLALDWVKVFDAGRIKYYRVIAELI